MIGATTSTKPPSTRGPSRWDHIIQKLEAAKPMLIRQGGVVYKKQPNGSVAAVVRYRDLQDGRCRHRSIYLGNDYFATKARLMIERWREEAVPYEHRRRQEMLQLYRKLAESRGYSSAAWSRLKSAVCRSFGDRRKELELAVRVRTDDHAFRYGRSRGRPSKSGLW